MIIAAHTLVYSDDAPATRAFFRDVLRLPFVGDADGSDEHAWLIFQTGPSETGVHPTRSEHGGQVWETPRHHQLAFVVDDIEATVAELEARGAVFGTGVEDHGFGLVAMLTVPGADDIQVYEARHPTAYDL